MKQRRTRRRQARAETATRAKTEKTRARETIAPALRLEAMLIALWLFVVTVAVFLPARGFHFIALDDPQYVSANPMVLNGLSSQGIRWAFTATSFYWHPLTWMSHMLDVELFGAAPGAHHMVNVVLHGASTAVLFLALARMTRATGASLVTSLLFALHPLHVESVAWVAERKDVLSTLFWMMCLYLYAGYAERPTRLRMTGVAVAFAVGLLAKPMILTLPFVLLLLDMWPLNRVGGKWRESLPRLAIEKVPLFVLSIGSIVITLVSQRGSRAVISLEALSLGQRLGNAAVSYAAYLRDMVWPAHLAPFYPLRPPSASSIVTGVIVLAAITIVAIRCAKSQPWMLVGWLWYLGTLAPVIGFVQAGDQGRADRFTYVPLVGVFIAVVWTIRGAVERFTLPRAARYAAYCALAIVLGSLTHRQLMYWKDDLTLWARTVAVTSGNYRAENLYGVALTDNGRLDEGIAHYEAALRSWPENPEAHNNLGAARMDQGRYQDAISEFEAAARAKPSNVQFKYNLAAALDAAGRRTDAIAQVKAGLAIDPGNPSLHEAARAFGLEVPKK
jgi:hypothetical protein